MRPDFSSPVIYAAGILCAWLILFLPFAVMARQLARADALSPTEAWLLGHTCGPVGVWLVRRANDRASQRAAAAAHAREHPPEDASPEVVDRRLRMTDGIPPADQLPGGRAFKPPLERKPRASGPVKMDEWRPPDSD